VRNKARGGSGGVGLYRQVHVDYERGEKDSTDKRARVAARQKGEGGEAGWRLQPVGPARYAARGQEEGRLAGLRVRRPNRPAKEGSSGLWAKS
jgi:hypothetical protein